MTHRIQPLTIAATMMCILLSGCTTVRYLPAESTRSDSIRVVTARTDAIHVTDSTVIDRSTDTVRIDRWRTVWRDRLTTDTIVSASRDTIRVPYPVETRVEVAAPLSGWQKALMSAGALSALLVAIRIISLLRSWRR